MKHILFMLLTGFALGQKVVTTFDKNIWTIADYTFITRFSKRLGFKPASIIGFIVILKRKGGVIQTVGWGITEKKVIKSIYEGGLSYTEIRDSL